MIQRNEVILWIAIFLFFQMFGINSDTDRDHTSLIDSHQRSVQIVQILGTTSPHTFQPSFPVQDIWQKTFSTKRCSQMVRINSTCRRKRPDKFEKLQSVEFNLFSDCNTAMSLTTNNLSDHTCFIDFNQCLQIVRTESSNVATTPDTFGYQNIEVQIRNTKEDKYRNGKNGFKLLECNAVTSAHTFRPCWVESDLFARSRISNSRKLDKN